MLNNCQNTAETSPHSNGLVIRHPENSYSISIYFWVFFFYIDSVPQIYMMTTCISCLTVIPSQFVLERLQMSANILVKSLDYSPWIWQVSIKNVSPKNQHVIIELFSRQGKFPLNMSTTISDNKSKSFAKKFNTFTSRGSSDNFSIFNLIEQKKRKF